MNTEKLARKRAYDALWRSKNRDRIHANNKKWASSEKGIRSNLNAQLKRRYKITLDHYEELWKAQEGKCAICAKHESLNGKRLTVDHCHITGQVRGLLCYVCNTSLAGFKDDLWILKNALNYIAKAEALS